MKPSPNGQQATPFWNNPKEDPLNHTARQMPHNRKIIILNSKSIFVQRFTTLSNVLTWYHSSHSSSDHSLEGNGHHFFSPPEFEIRRHKNSYKWCLLRLLKYALVWFSIRVWLVWIGRLQFTISFYARSWNGINSNIIRALRNFSWNTETWSRYHHVGENFVF